MSLFDCCLDKRSNLKTSFLILLGFFLLLGQFVINFKNNGQYKKKYTLITQVMKRPRAVNRMSATTLFTNR